MSNFRIEGGRTLRGSIEVRGSKNAALKIVPACLLTQESCRLHNIPRIEDVFRMVELLESVGVKSEWTGDHELTVEATTVDPSTLKKDLVERLRASIVLMGALLGRCGSATLASPGGDQIGARPLDTHFDAFRELGITVSLIEDQYELTQGSRDDVKLTMSEFSVTATENVVLASVLAAGRRTVIHCAAADPSVQDLCWFLSSLGARINGVGTNTLTIEGVKKLTGSNGYVVMPDPIETFTLFILAATSRSDIQVVGCAPEFLVMELQKLRESGVNVEFLNDRTGPGGNYRFATAVIHPGQEIRPIRHLHNMRYPGLSPDTLPPMTVLLTQAEGESLVHDWMYEGRQRYVGELQKMGANIDILDPHRILVKGPSALHGTTITNYDIRAGASLLIAALIADGKSELGPVYQLDRGYEVLDRRLNAVGAHIKRVG